MIATENLTQGQPPTIMAFCGRAGAGKSTAADRLETSYGFEQVAFATVLKEMLERLLSAFGVDYAVLYEPHLKERPLAALPGSPTPRQLMQAFGDAGRAVHPDLWVHALGYEAGLMPQAEAVPIHDRIVIPDVRYPNEAKLVSDFGGHLTRIARPNASDAGSQHSSEWHAPTLPANDTLINNFLGPDGLRHRIDLLMDGLGLKPRAF